MTIPTIGAIKDSYDIRTYQYAPRGAFDWETGFDIEKVIGTKLIPKDQNGSSSCGGQAWAYYGEVLETIATKTYEPRSARWIYAPVRAPGGGSMGKELSAFVVKNGFALEKDAVSYENGKPPSESFMSHVPTLSKEGKEHAEVSKALSYVQVKADIDVLAQALQDNNGVCIAFYFENNGTMRTEFVKPPLKQTYAHWVYVGKAKMIKGKKHLGFINSWGNRTGKNGWQWMSEDYFVNGNVWYGWTLAWDYRPAKIKVMMKEVIRLLNLLLLNLLKKK
jgi:hypothetical protein